MLERAFPTSVLLRFLMTTAPMGVMEYVINLMQTAIGSIGNLATLQFPLLTKEDCKFTKENFKCKVPNDYVFVIGDNRSNTLVGFVPIGNILGSIE